MWVVAHPRAAGFTVLGFTLVVVTIALAWLGQRQEPQSHIRLRWAMPAVILGFALWANLHGGFVAGLALIGFATVGLALDHRLEMPVVTDRRRIGLLALTGLLAAATTLVATPLGGALLSYLMSFRNPAISLISTEWQPAFRSPLALAYIAVAAAFAALLWWRAGSARTWTPMLVTIAFVGLALLSLRNIIFIGPVVGLMIVSSVADRSNRIPAGLIALAVAASAVVAVTWVTAVGPARNEPLLSSRLVGYALRHPPSHGHIAAYAGIGSYMLWRSPSAPVELDGWLEHFSATELRDTYAVLDGRTADPTPFVRNLHIGAVIADRRVAIKALVAHGFTVAFRNRSGAYLVRR
jgi:MFS family permease